MKDTKPKSRASRIVTVIICVLILLFAGLILHSYLTRNSAAPAGRQTGGSPGQGAAAAPGAGTAQGGGAPVAPAGGGQGAGTAQRGGAPAASGSGGQGTAQRGLNATAVRVVPVVRGTIENSVVINGDVLTRSQISIYPTVAGKVTELRVRQGDTVRQGEVVAMVDPSRPGEVYSRSPVTSTIGGTVLSTPVSTGDTVSTNTAVITVGDLSGLVVETFVPERFVTAARRGLPAQVSLEALPGELFPAVVDEVSPILDPASRTLRIRLRFNRQDERIRAGMFAMVSLVTSSRSGIPVIPRAALINTYGSWIVFIADEQNIARRREITLGLESEDLVEVTGGLELGDRVVTAGQNFLSGGDPVRVIE